MRAISNFLFLSLLLLAYIETANAQWQITYGPFGFNFVRVQCFAKQGTNLFAGTQGDGAWISTDNSAGPWTKVGNGITGKSVRALLVNGTDLFAGTDSGVFITTDNGSNWTEKNNGLTNTSVSSFAEIGENIFAATQGGGVFLSTNSGTNWTLVNNGLIGDYVFALVASGTNLFAASFKAPSAQVYLSTDNDTNWSLANTGLPNVFELCFAVSGTNVFAGAYSNGVYLTNDNGANWVEVNQGFGSSRTIRTLAMLGEDLFAGFYDGNVFRRPLSQMITSVEQISDLRPTDYILVQNFPNPFNPTTTFRFSIPTEEYVTLKVYDAFGQEVTTLISEVLQTGHYEKNWDASGIFVNNAYSSGVYYYRIRVGNFIQTKKMLLLK